ncbi:MAG: (Fe-S)-binding protein [Lachnospiraceae bacterium]|nr:(Fe-S)-binding protein [Lachnospiraceae bacterium]
MCVHCHICKTHCAFLTKYDLDIGDTKALSALAYHCFLCGKCTAVCPKGIDGRAFLLGIRCDETEANGGRLRQKGYGLLLAEKKKYRFRNVKHATGKTVLFPGCNFPSFFPKTLEKLLKLLGEQDIGVWYDCCGKPVAELGLTAAAADSLTRMEETLRERGIKELVTMCPNCYDYLTPRLSVPVIDIYTKLKELGIGRQDIPAGEVFLPCPDREKRELLACVQDFVSGTLSPREGAQCCGLGGCAAAKEPALAAQMAMEAGRAKAAEPGGTDASVPLYTYCATCAGSLCRNGAEGVRHVLSLILETDEAPDVKHSLRNRVKTRFV